MKMDGIKSNLAWKEIEVHNLMEVDETKSNLIRLGKKQNSINLMEMDEAADWIKGFDDLVTKHFGLYQNTILKVKK